MFFTRHETRITAFMLFTSHETRITDFIAVQITVGAQGPRHPKPLAARTAAPAARSLLSCALWRGMGRLWRGMGGILPLSRCPRSRPPFTLGLTASAARRAVPVALGLLPLRRTQNEPMLRKGNVLDSVRTKPDSTLAGMGL